VFTPSPTSLAQCSLNSKSSSCSSSSSSRGGCSGVRGGSAPAHCRQQPQRIPPHPFCAECVDEHGHGAATGLHATRQLLVVQLQRERQCRRGRVKHGSGGMLGAACKEWYAPVVCWVLNARKVCTSGMLGAACKEWYAPVVFWMLHARNGMHRVKSGQGCANQVTGSVCTA